MASPVARARFGRRGSDGGSSSTVPARKAASVKLVVGLAWFTRDAENARSMPGDGIGQRERVRRWTKKILQKPYIRNTKPTQQRHHLHRQRHVLAVRELDLPQRRAHRAVVQASERHADLADDKLRALVVAVDLGEAGERVGDDAAGEGEEVAEKVRQAGDEGGDDATSSKSKPPAIELGLG
ncbi:hypothetical protein [Oryza sativa Japonica Group]|uniref:Uncharacterized protein n=1 Tax=Oryza sativa subsp. japonica TaxID=39947 RepID=Q5NBC1_ORYSJ|nr:hypothetical protein [Oryza sativa Japonica Group]